MPTDVNGEQPRQGKADVFAAERSCIHGFLRVNVIFVGSIVNSKNESDQ